MSFSSPGVNSDFSLVLLPDGIGQGWVSRGRGGSPAAPFLLPRGSSGDAVWDCVDGLSALEVGKASLLLFACRDPPWTLPAQREGGSASKVRRRGPWTRPREPRKSDRSRPAAFALSERLGSNEAKSREMGVGPRLCCFQSFSDR